MFISPRFNASNSLQNIQVNLDFKKFQQFIFTYIFLQTYFCTEQKTPNTPIFFQGKIKEDRVRKVSAVEYQNQVIREYLRHSFIYRHKETSWTINECITNLYDVARLKTWNTSTYMFFFYGFHNIYVISFAKTQCHNRCLGSGNQLLDAQVDCQQWDNFQIKH